MEIILILVFVFLLGIFLGWKIREHIAIKRIHESLENITDDVVREFKSKVIDITVEDHDGVFFVYRKEDGSYLAHGPSMEKLEDILVEKFPGKLFNANPEDLEKLNSR
jgi:hypothetical protein